MDRTKLPCFNGWLTKASSSMDKMDYEMNINMVNAGFSLPFVPGSMNQVFFCVFGDNVVVVYRNYAQVLTAKCHAMGGKNLDLF